VTREFARGTHNGFLLHGITGSGKTEVYLRCIDEAHRKGKSALVLIPEIALIPQTTARFRRRFGSGVAVLHSRLTGPQRCTIWTKAARGKVKVVIGARSAVFVPLKDLGIIVVDEEQDGSYKQEEKPHYNAVDVARFRAENEGAVLLLGSATLSLETYESSKKNAVTYLKLRSRPVIDRLPEVKIVDMREREGVFSEELLGSLEACIGRGEQAIVLLNRRGHASFIQCKKCGWIERCPYCSISLTYHSRGHRLVCHYCGFRASPPDTCRNCSAYKIAHRGIGTQRVEMELGNLLPGVRVARMDLDTTRGKRGHLKVLERFARGHADILLGTQMVAKGHHYPNVTVVGVVSADWGMNFPDFRAAERTFRLLFQAAGRAGRGEKEGTVIVQTLAPDHYLFQYLIDGDFEGFAERELEFRGELRYPPSEHLMLFTVSSGNLERAREAAESAAESLNDLFAQAGFDVLGPTPALIAKLRGRCRFQVLVKGSPDERRKKSAVAAVLAGLARFKNVDVQWDVDPMNM
jgi:primosomal protein N' (replication factor Y)